MGDNLKITKDKRQRSSSSLAVSNLEGTRSERKLEIRASIPEVDDQFAIAEARCDDLQEKIDLVKALKRKRKLKKRSMTQVTEPALLETVPYISVRTQPKKRIAMAMQQVSGSRRSQPPQAPANNSRGYLDPATAEQHRMLRHVRGYIQNYKPQPNDDQDKPTFPEKYMATRQKPRRARADGDSAEGRARMVPAATGVAHGEDDFVAQSTQRLVHEPRQRDGVESSVKKIPQEVFTAAQQTKQQLLNRRRHVPRDVPLKDDKAENAVNAGRGGVTRPEPTRRRPPSMSRQDNMRQMPEERPVVELFYKNRATHSTEAIKCSSQDKVESDAAFDDEIVEVKERHHSRRVKYHSRRYELPTLASQMKQAGTRYYSSANSNHAPIPFIISKSTAPSHNIGVNIQQVLNGFKHQQPLHGIPLSIAHHMGLGHIPSYENKNVQQSLDNLEINAIRLGSRLLRLPTKCMSFNRLLSLYRESDGLVSRFLHAISRPQYFYTSMYNLATRKELDEVTTTIKGGRNLEAKQNLTAYASLYREYEHIDKCLKEKYDPELERRRDDLVRELAAREDHIRKVVQECKSSAEGEPVVLRASASAAEDGYRFSTLKFNIGDTQQQ